MIPKVPKRKSKASTSFKQSIRYLLNEAKQDDGDTKLINLLSEKTAAAEMQAVSGLSKRVEDPVYHVVLSWPSTEKPDRDSIFASADYALRSLGFNLDRGGHSAVYAIHRDTDNLHVHIIANRIHPETGLAVDLWQSNQRLHKACRELELKHGWSPSPGAWIIENGEVVRAHYQSEPGDRPSERDVRAQIGQTFGDYVRSAGQSKIIQSADTWQSYHAALSHFNLVLTPRGGGFVITDKDSPGHYHIQGGKLGSRYKAVALIKRFGEYQANTNTQQQARLHYRDPRDISVTPNNKRARDPALKQQRKDARDTLFATYQREKTEFYEVQKTNKKQLWDQQTIKEKSRWDEHTRLHREKRKPIIDETPRGKKRLVSSMLSLEKAQEKEKLDQLRRLERLALKAHFTDAHAFPIWRQWVREQASQGNPVAISVYRGLRYRDQNRDHFTSDHVSNQSPDEILRHSDMQRVYAMEMEQGIGFWTGQKHFATDYGQDISVRDTEHDSIELSFRIALAKWGGRVEVTGSDSFVQAAQTIAKTVGYDLKQHHDRLSDPALPIQRM